VGGTMRCKIPVYVRLWRYMLNASINTSIGKIQKSGCYFVSQSSINNSSHLAKEGLGWKQIQMADAHGKLVFSKTFTGELQLNKN